MENFSDSQFLYMAQFIECDEESPQIWYIYFNGKSCFLDVFDMKCFLQIIHTMTSFLRFAPVFIMFLLPFVVSFHVLLGVEVSRTHMGRALSFA